MIKKIYKLLFWLSLSLTLANGAAAADEPTALGFHNVLLEFLLRPMGFLSLLGGSALFVASSPFTAVASLEEPHDAWFNSFNGFVGAPIRYTFTRPIGDYTFKAYTD